MADEPDELTLTLDLQLAYRISEELDGHSNARLHWAADRFWHDRASVDEHANHQRGEAIMRMAYELDRRKAPMRELVQADNGRWFPKKLYPAPMPL